MHEVFSLLKRRWNSDLIDVPRWWSWSSQTTKNMKVRSCSLLSYDHCHGEEVNCCFGTFALFEVMVGQMSTFIWCHKSPFFNFSFFIIIFVLMRMNVVSRGTIKFAVFRGVVIIERFLRLLLYLVWWWHESLQVFHPSQLLVLLIEHMQLLLYQLIQICQRISGANLCVVVDLFHG